MQVGTNEIEADIKRKKSIIHKKNCKLMNTSKMPLNSLGSFTIHVMPYIKRQ